MSVLENLDEEECYLWAILSDPSGLDQAEFLWVDDEQADGCFRAWAFQWPWWRDTSQRHIEQGSRSIGKSKSISIKAGAFPFLHPGQEMVITAPEGNHLDAITDVIETRILATRLLKEMLALGRGGIKHRPFLVNFQNGSRIMGRIPQRDGKGIKGIHPVWLELDEGQDYPDKGWTEIIETLKMGTEGSVWRVHGVTRGVRDFFYQYTQPGSGWKVRRITSMHRPEPYWSDSERQSKIEMYGSRDHPDYRRNVLGLHGDATNPLFVLHRLMACTDTDVASNYNNYEYVKLKINNEMVLEHHDQIIPLLDLPQSHKQYTRTWIGMDVGYTNSPSVIVVFGEDTPKKGEEPRLKLLAKITLERISNPAQVETILHMVNFYKPQAFSMDKTGVGLPLFQDIQNRLSESSSRNKKVVDIIKGYNFSSKILVDFDSSIDVDEFKGDAVRDAGVFRNVLEYSSDKLRQLVDQKRILLPYDTDLLKEFNGQTYTYKAEMDMYGRRKSYSTGEFHALDAARMAILGYSQFAIEELTRTEKQEAVTEIFLWDV